MKQSKVSLTLEEAAREFAVDKETLRRGLLNVDAPAGKGVRHSLSTIWRALSGDLKAAKAREALANALAKERDNRIADGEVIPLADNLAWQERVGAPVRQRLLAMPGVMGPRCNPTDPAFAQRALIQWLDETLPLLRTEITKAADEPGA